MKICILAALFIGASFTATAADFRIRGVDFPGASSTFLFALNDETHCVGAEADQNGNFHAIVFRDGILRLLDPNGLVGASAQSFALSINNRGEIAGALIDAGGISHGFVHHANGIVESVDFPGGFNTQAFGINDHGTVIGVYATTAGGTPTHAFVRRGGQFINIDLPGGITTPFSINDREEIAGQFVALPNTNGVGYVQKADGQFALFTAPASIPQGTFFISINNRNQILGAYASATVAQQNFLATDGDYVSFDLPPRFGASFVSAQTVNDADEIVGFYTDGANVNHAFLAIPVKDSDE
jgi:probable HAF family extracellular repeat protein